MKRVPTESLRNRWNMRALPTPKQVSGALLRILILALLLFGSAAMAAQIAVPNGDFTSATNANAGAPIGGGLLTAPASGVAIGTTGPWTGTYAGALGVVAPPQLQIDSSAHVADIDGILGLNVLGSLVANSGSFNQIFPAADANNLYRASKVYTLGVHVDAAPIVGVDLLSNGIFGASLTATNGATTNTVATSSTNPATLVLLSTGHYQLSLPFTTPASGPPISRRIGVSLFSHPQGLVSLSLLSTIKFSNVTLNRVGTIPSAISVTIGSQSGAQSATVGQPFAHPLSVTVVDTDGDAVPGVSVTFTAPGAGASAVLNPAAPVTTDANGVATVDATANTVAGEYSVSATVAGVATPATFDLTNTAGTASKVKPGVNGSLAQSGSPQSATVATEFTLPLTVLVTDQFDNPVSGASVTFTVPASGAGANLSNGTPTTNASGIAAVTATANNIAGVYNIPATVSGGTQTTTFNLTNTAGTASKVKPGVNGSLAQSGSPQSATVGTAFTLPLTVLVTDQFDNPVSGASVTFTPPASGAGAVLSSTTPTTNVSGVAAVTATANNIAGVYNIPATVSGGTQTTTFALTNTAGAPTKVKPGVNNNPASSGTPQSAIVTKAFALPLTVLVTDAFDNPVSAAMVTFAPPQTGASANLSSNSVATNANGVASVTAIANSQTGLYHIPATVVDGTQSLTFDLTNTAAATTGVGGTPQATVAGTEFDCALIAKVNDVSGPVAGVGVQFTAIAAGNGASATFSSVGGSENTNPLTVNTDSSGFAAVIAKGNAIAGTYNVTAGLSGSGQTTTYLLTNLDVNDPIFRNGFEIPPACAEAQ